MIDRITYTPFPSQLHILVKESGITIYDSRDPKEKLFTQADSGKIPHAKIGIVDQKHEIFYWVEKIEFETSKLPSMHHTPNISFIELHVREFCKRQLS